METETRKLIRKIGKIITKIQKGELRPKTVVIDDGFGHYIVRNIDKDE